MLVRTDVTDGEPSRKVKGVVWVCNVCDQDSSSTFMVEHPLENHYDFTFDSVGPDDKGVRTWPVDATYDVPQVKDSLLSFEFDDGAVFMAGCTGPMVRSGGVRQLVLRPDESLNVAWFHVRHWTLNPSASLPDSWSPSESATVRLVPSLVFEGGPLDIPEVLPRACAAGGYPFPLPSELCGGHCAGSDELIVPTCPYECPSKEPSLSVEARIIGPYPEDLFFPRQVFH